MVSPFFVLLQFESFFKYLLTEKRCSLHTLDAYKNDLSKFSAYCMVTYEISNYSDVTQPIVRSWLAQLLDEKYAASSVHRKLSAVRSWFRFLMKTNQTKHNPVRGISKPKMPGRLPIFVEESAAAKIYTDTIDKDDFGAVTKQLIMKILYETGMRQSEMLNMKDADIDPSLCQIKILGKRQKVRFVPIGKLLLEEIMDYKIARAIQFPEIETSYLLFTDKGKKITKTFLYLSVKNYLSQVTTIRKKSPHVLRHTFATHMLNNGADLNVIKEVLGHSSLAATQVYTHNSIEKLKGIHQKMHPRNK